MKSQISDFKSSAVPVAIVGGGITGLAAAHALSRAGRSVRLFEAASVVGGAIQSERSGDWLVEAGPNSLQENSPALTQLIADLGLESAKRYAEPAAKNRYILRNGVPCAAPVSPPAFFTSRLFSFGAKARLLGEFFTRPRQRPADVSLAEFVRAHFGRELVDYGLRPFVSGVYAGDAEKLSARHAFPSLWASERNHGSILRGQIAAAKAKRARGETRGPARLISFAEGLGQLPQAIAAHLPPGTLETSARVEALTPGPPWRITWSRAGETHSEPSSHVLLAVPAATLANLSIGTAGEKPLTDLAGIDYPPVCSLFLGFRRDQVTHPLDGFGLLVPPKENRSVLGVLFSSTLFGGRAPAGHVALTVMVGGALQRELAQLALDDLLPMVRRELESLLGVRGEPVFVRQHVWPRAIPQYNLGYERFLEAMTRCEATHPGLFIGGHVRDGIAVPACVAAGQKLANRALGRAPQISPADTDGNRAQR